MQYSKVFILVVVISLSVCDENDSNINKVDKEDFEKIEVQTKYGVVSGKVERTFLKKINYFSFKGIPFAEPPVGKLRFKPPEPYQGWKDTLKAYDEKPTCMQFNTRARADEPFGVSGSEDCLYISIFTPNLKGNAPVIVFDYNDNYRTGFNGTKTYSPDFFMEEDVIVVTIAHRLSLFGYLTTMDSVILPNNGIRDFILGLNWIKDNINIFGGDPQRVTLMGNRGGAAIADILLYSEKAKGLFSGVIMQSGTALEATYFEKNLKERSFELGTIFNITTDDSKVLLEGLQKIDAAELIDKDGHTIDKDQIKYAQLSIFPFSPVVENTNDDAVLTTLPDNGKIVNDVPIIIGMNSREGIDLASHYLFQPQILEEDKKDNKSVLFLFPIRSEFKFDPESAVYKDAMQEILTFYFKQGFFDYDGLLEYPVYMGDLLQNYALNLAAKSLAEKSQSPVFYYMFDFCGSLNENLNYIRIYTRFSIEPWGATILDELCYLHLCSRISNEYEEINSLLTEQNEIKVLKKMVRMWTNFAKTGNPTPNEDDNVLKGFKWKPIEKGSNKAAYLHITRTLTMKTDPLGNREKFWDDFLAKYSLLAVDGEVQAPTEDTHDEL